MQRLAVLIALLMIASISTTDSQACTLRPPVVLPGESIEQASLREERQSQKHAWNEAEFVALARVKASWLANGDVTSQLVIVASIKGSNAPRRIRFADPGICGRGPRLDVGRFVLIYGYWARGRLGPITTRRLGIIRVVPLGEVVDPRVPAALRATAKRLRGDQ